MTEIDKKKFNKAKLWDYFILVARVWLAWTLFRYGWAKLIDGQFGVSEATMDLPLKEIDLFRISWYLADHEPFKSFIGISQIVTAGLLVYKRTAIIGAFISIPIWLNILMWDMTFMGLYTGFTIRIPYYLVLTSLIIWHAKDKVLVALQTLLKGSSIKYRFPLWTYLLIIPLGFVIELVGGIPIAIVYYVKQLFS
ncbi:hypothetical protein [Agriterribacter sp.]|uniref:hypothetical protein n=1 Tax=Agriterribacter sp. TaxID=2821509 RepID=UPI002C6A58BE|nr:hypothetical protein [Agriterribacter sp.]HRP57770.1 hypothetical protein [Agriterribacter sp.]